MILWSVIFVVLALGGLSVGLLWEGLADKISIQHRQANLLALQICEKGMVEAGLEIRAMKDASTDGIGNVSGDYAGGAYRVTAKRRVDYPDRWILTARGDFGHSVKRVQSGLRRRVRSDWVEGLFAKDELVFNGTAQTDAYDSRLGTWNSQAVNNDGAGPYALGGGDVGSNVGIKLNGSSGTIRGNAIPGPLNETVTSGTPTIWGDVFPRRREIPIPDVPLADFEAALAVNDNAQFGGGPGGGGPGGGGPKGPYDSKNMSLTGNGGETITLTGGTYFFTSVQLTGGSTIEVTGPTTIYITDSFDTSGGTLINASGVPSDLIVYAHPYPLPSGSVAPNPGIKFGGGAGSAMAVYAPEMPVVVHGDGDIYGAILGSTITVMGDASFHYDKALSDWDKFSTVTVERLYWRELSARLR